MDFDNLPFTVRCQVLEYLPYPSLITFCESHPAAWRMVHNYPEILLNIPTLRSLRFYSPPSAPSLSQEQSSLAPSLFTWLKYGAKQSRLYYLIDRTNNYGSRGQWPGKIFPTIQEAYAEFISILREESYLRPLTNLELDRSIYPPLERVNELVDLYTNHIAFKGGDIEIYIADPKKKNICKRKNCLLAFKLERIDPFGRRYRLYSHRSEALAEIRTRLDIRSNMTELPPFLYSGYLVHYYDRGASFFFYPSEKERILEKIVDDEEESDVRLLPINCSGEIKAYQTTGSALRHLETNEIFEYRQVFDWS